MKVTAQKIRTPDEEYEYLNRQLQECGNFFPWDEHPNRLRASNIQAARLRKKLSELIASEEFQDYNQWYKYKN